MPSLALTRRGQAWLGNFAEADQPVAQRLLDGVEMVSDSRFRRELKDLLARARGGQSDTVVAAYAVHNLPQRFAPHYFGCAGPHSQITPLQCPSTAHTGSEMIVQNVLLKTAKALNISVDHTVDQLYTSRVDRILLVTDNIATGQEIETFLAFMEANPRLRSWKSFGWLKFEIVAHSITESALRALGRKAVVHFEQLSRTFETTDWSDSELEAVRALCRKYGSIPRESLGRKRAESLQVFGHTFGNGTPAVLRQAFGVHGGTWSPLLPHGRDYGLGSAEMNALQEYRAPHSLIAKLRGLKPTLPSRLSRMERIATQARAERITGKYGAAIFALLIAIDAGHRRPLDLMKAGSMSFSRLRTVARAAHDLGLIEGFEGLAMANGPTSPGQGRYPSQRVEIVLTLTVRGRRLLRRRTRSRDSKRGTSSPAGERGALSMREEVNEDARSKTRSEPPPYYPQQLR